jgi:hypothetical protein
MTMDEEGPDEQRRLNLPALNPVSFSDAGPSVLQPTRYFVPCQPSAQSSTKALNKRPSTAALAQSNDVLLPATRQVGEAAESASGSVSPEICVVSSALPSLSPDDTRSK